MSLITEVLDRYRVDGVVKAGELLLAPDDAVRLARELLPIHVPIIGVNIWYRVGVCIAEDPNGLDFSSILSRSDASTETVRRAISFTENQLPSNIELVSFVLDDDGWWKTQTQKKA